jgi:DNA-directed RNA polymerase subunit RPC12/RpoP
MLNMPCPYCSTRINALAEPWQQQRASKEKHCPSCGGKVEMAYSAKLYVVWLLALATVISLCFALMGISPISALPPAFGLALIPSMCLRKTS